MLIPNTLFRMGGAAMILTNRLTEYGRAKYELQHVVRVHLGADDMAYECAPALFALNSCYLRMACLYKTTVYRLFPRLPSVAQLMWQLSGNSYKLP